MITNTKTKKSIILSALALAFMLSSAISFAAYDASSESNNCDGHDCQSWHNTGITHSAYPNGTDFPTFNNYRDATKAGRSYEEMQFMYIESERADESNYPWPDPWYSTSNYNFSNGINHTINFTDSDPVKIGFWGYMHNNGEGDLSSATATGTHINMTNWSSSSPRTTYSPKMTIWADNTKPRSIWANVGLSGNVPFTLNPVDLYIVREDGTSPSLAGSTLQSFTSTGGLQIRTNANLNHGVFKSSDRHIVYIYVEFEATPEESGLCHSLNITDPSEQSLTVDANGFVDEPLAFTVDTDPNIVSGYQVLSTRDTITFDNSGQSDIETNKTSMVMDGGPAPNEPLDMVQVWALDQNGNGIQECWDTFAVIPEVEEENTCEVFNTIPTPPGVDNGAVPLNEFVTIDIDELLDTNGDPYLDNGAIPQIRYCYNQDEITFLPDSGNAVIDGNGCAIALATDTMNVVAERAGLMSIQVVGAEDVCKDVFKTKGETQPDEICLSLDINQSEFTGDEDIYRVTVETDPEGLSYDVEWFVDSTNGDGMSPVTESGNSIDLADQDYSFTPGDTLVARATEINDPNNVCMDQLTNEPEDCTKFKLDRDKFQRGQNNEICIDYTDWPLDEGDDLEYSVDGGSTQTVELYDEAGDLCFLLRENDVEDADHIVVWVPEWEDVCNDDLEVEVEPPVFKKNAKSSDSHAFSHRTIANFSDTYVDYEITYTHFATEEIDVVITDTIGTEGYIQGYIAGTTTEINSAPLGGRIYYDDGSMEIYVDGDRVEDCDDIDEEDRDEEVCYEGNIGSSNGVEINNVPDREEVVVEYRGEIIDSAVNPESCSDPDSDLNDTGVCGEIYPNTARFKDDLDYDGSDEAEVIIPCPFIIIRAGGDVFLENPFDYGVDTLSCAEIRTSDTPVITGTPPDDRDLFTTGGDSSVLTQYDERLCNSDSEGSTDIKGISSLICELELTSEELTQQAIVQSLSRNVTLFARYAKNLNGNPVINGSSNLPSSTNDVYIKDDGMLTLGGEFADKARTIVVLNNDVYINSNITFKDPASLTDPRKVPSLAVIVIGGNIIIDPSVSETNAIFFVQEGTDGGGQICEGGSKPACGESAYNSDNRLTHYGSIYGDIEHLLKYRVKSGDPTKEEGAILIRFDNRIYLNTPPLLNKLIDVTQKAF